MIIKACSRLSHARSCLTDQRLRQAGHVSEEPLAHADRVARTHREGRGLAQVHQHLARVGGAFEEDAAAVGAVSEAASSMLASVRPVGRKKKPDFMRD